MNKNKIVALIEAGAGAWNKWKASVPKNSCILDGVELTGLNLDGIDFSGLSMRRVRITRCSLKGAKLISTDLSFSILENSELAGAKFIAAVMENTCFSKCGIVGASFLTAAVKGAVFERMDLRRHDLRSFNLCDLSLAHCNLEQQNLAHLNLTGINLQGASLRNADLTNANFTKAKLQGADLQGAKLQHIVLRQADVRDVSLRGQNLTHADCTGAKLTNCDLREANITHGKLAASDITGSKLWKIQSDNWDISGIECRYAYWDQAGNQKTTYGKHEFERIYAEKITIELSYPYRLMGTELATLPIFIEHLEATFWGIVMRLKTVEDVAGGARVTLIVEEPGNYFPAELRDELQKEASKVQMAQLTMRRNVLMQNQLKEEIANIKEKFWPRLLELSADNEREQVRNLTVVFMDLKGFSQWADDELSDKLALFRGLTKPILNKWQAGYPNMEGDSLRVTFHNASAGLACACMMRSVLTAAGFEVRIGVALGQVTVIHNEITDISDIEGSSISMAARLEAVAKPGQVLATEKIRHYADRKGLFDFDLVRTPLSKSIGDKKAGDIVECYAVEMHEAAQDIILPEASAANVHALGVSKK